MQSQKVDEGKVREYGCPGGALGWYYLLAPALSNATLPDMLIVAWDKPCVKKKSPKKMYGVYADHATFWNALCQVPLNERFAYEILPKHSNCKAYWDIEYCVENKGEESRKGAEALLGLWIESLKSKILELFGVHAMVCVLDGTREIEENGLLKVSVHVIVYNVVFYHNQCNQFVFLRSQIPSLREIYEKHKDSLVDGPSESDTGAPDLSVWKDNQIFRCFSCSKRGGSTPLLFLNSLSDSTDPLDAFLTNCRQNIVESESRDDLQVKRRKTKKRKIQEIEDDEHHGMVSYMMQKYPREIACLKNEIQSLLNSWKNCTSRVEKLVRAEPNLRFQCVNIQDRPCIFSREIHSSNTPIIWLDAPYNVNQGELSSHYIVNYICKSSECMCSGIIGEMRLNMETQRYEHKKIMPAILQGQRGPVRAKIRSEQVVFSSNGQMMENMPSKSIHITKENDNCKEDDACLHEVNENEEEVELTLTRNLIDEKVAGYGWSLYELTRYGKHNTYKEVKERMEKTICKITRPHVMFLSFTNHNDYHHYTYDNMAKNIKHVFYYKKNDPDEAPTLARFFPSWTDDPTLRSYESLVFDPSPDRVKTGQCDLNVWPGLKIELSSLNPLNNNDIEDLVAPIRNHILHVLVDGNEDHAEWLIDWLANIVQRPDKKTQVPIVISGKQGVGKGIIFDFFREHILGFSISAQIQNPGQDLFSRFANKHVNKVFLQIDEGEGMSKYADQMKNLITCDSINYEIKGLQPLTASNYINIVITTNHERPVLVETSDRRYVLFKASDKYVKNDEYYLRLASHLKLQKVAIAFFQYLQKRDLTKYSFNFQASRPMTDYYLQARKNSIPILQRFLSALISSRREKLLEISTTGLFRDFTKFQEIGKFQSTMTLHTFCMKLRALPGIVKKNEYGTSLICIQVDTLYQHLCENHEFDEDATIEG